MPTINVRGVPQETYDDFRRLARADGKSLNTEARTIFEEGIRQRMVRRSREEALQMADENRQQLGRLNVDSLELLHEGREER